MTGATSSVQELILRNMFGVFGERDATARAATIAEIYLPDAVLYLGDDVVRGTDALGEHVQTLLDGAPGFVFRALGTAEVDGRLGTGSWGFGPEGDPPVITGRDVIRVQDGRIAELLVFVHPPTVR